MSLKSRICEICSRVDCVFLIRVRVVVVSRRETVCNTLAKDITCERYSVEGLPDQDSENLFYHHLGECPPARKKDVPKILEVCGGLPLALELVGRHLSDEKVKMDSAVWIAAIEGLKKCHFDNSERPDRDPLHAAVRWSFDRLSDETKRVFVDICLLCRNEKWKWAEWLGNGSQLKSLTDYSLIKNSEDSMIQIHDLLAALGKSEAKSTTETRVLVKDRESLRKFLENDLQPRHTIEGFVYRCKRASDISQEQCELRAEDLDAMHKSLRIIIVDVDQRLWNMPRKTSETCQEIPPHLEIWSFCGQGNMRGKILEKNLANGARWVLEAMKLPDSPLVFPYMNIISSMEQLRVLRIKFCTDHGLDLEQVQMPPNLQVLKLHGLSGFRRFCSDAFARCTYLHTFMLKRCSDLKLLPLSFAGLDELRTIVLYGNPELETLPSFNNFLSLEKLEVKYCPKIASPSGVGNLSLLRTLSLPITGVDTLSEVSGV